MGGRGSGRRPSYAGKDATEESMPLDIRRLSRAGGLGPGRTVTWEWTLNERPQASIRIRAVPWQVTLSYRYTPRGGAAEVINQIVRLETTPCTLGGSRPWFACPACGQRVAVIYGAGRLFACRQCKGLAYSSQSEAADDRALRRADRVRKRLAWVPGVAHGHGPKPAGMHRLTFDRLWHLHDVLVNVSLAGMAKRLGLLRSQLEGAGDDLDLGW